VLHLLEPPEAPNLVPDAPGTPEDWPGCPLAAGGLPLVCEPPFAGDDDDVVPVLQPTAVSVTRLVNAIRPPRQRLKLLARPRVAP
jgi:hypothetical protein